MRGPTTSELPAISAGFMMRGRGGRSVSGIQVEAVGEGAPGTDWALSRARSLRTASACLSPVALRCSLTNLSKYPSLNSERSFSKPTLHCGVDRRVESP